MENCEEEKTRKEEIAVCFEVLSRHWWSRILSQSCTCPRQDSNHVYDEYNLSQFSRCCALDISSERNDHPVEEVEMADSRKSRDKTGREAEASISKKKDCIISFLIRRENCKYDDVECVYLKPHCFNPSIPDIWPTPYVTNRVFSTNSVLSCMWNCKILFLKYYRLVPVFNIQLEMPQRLEIGRRPSVVLHRIILHGRLTPSELVKR